ncbi:sugar phosphate nucleotidyltransferase [Psittacicella hinzii]|uniref:Mannose-1-phosphate guanylyltransferase n=1 Tax=Psittacicella hinzii TaxID=2028575 RepID=A0A3A1YE60_9GAMM|nr:sugar phosphate nucleotidyltransferase [Psittacicella hinzii]RIY35706.1 hypothetical protein CKF58_06530 [Psittacicella hinzii]
MYNHLYPVILAGGAGTRLWPISRTLYPKQFQHFNAQHSMFQQTILRVQDLSSNLPLVLCNEDHRFIAAEQLHQLNLLKQNIILEPISRNTAPALTIAALHLQKRDQQALMLVLPADHQLTPEQTFISQIEQAIPTAQDNKLVSFGIEPQGEVETGYGYILYQHLKNVTSNTFKDSLLKAADIKNTPANTTQGYSQNTSSNAAFKIKSFVEKPNKEQALALLAQGQALWNSGIYLFSAQAYLEAIKEYAPEIYQASFQAYEKSTLDYDFIRLKASAYNANPDISIDYAIMEKTSQGVVYPLNLQWSDLGSWQSLWESSIKDELGNVELANCISIDSHNNYFMAEQNNLIASVGVNNLVVVQTPDATFVADKSRSQEIKQLVQQIKQKHPEITYEHRVIYRPWGKILILDKGDRFQIKKITIKPHGKVATQIHKFKTEHWIITQGTAKVILAKQEHILRENQSLFIPVGTAHSIENLGDSNLEMIEVQSGQQILDKDIIRLEQKDYLNQ